MGAFKAAGEGLMLSMSEKKKSSAVLRSSWERSVRKKSPRKDADFIAGNYGKEPLKTGRLKQPIVS